MRTVGTTRLVPSIARSLALGLALLIAVPLASPARAGGPTSVLLVVPGSGETAALHTHDADYAELARLVGAEGSSVPAGNPDGGHQTDTAVTLTWLIHDVEVWRVDRVYLGGAGGPWVASQVRADGSIWDAAVSWYRPEEPKALLALLDRLVLDPTPGGGNAVTDPGRAPDAAAVEPAASGEEGDAPVGDGGTSWPLLAVAALGGALATAAIALALARRQSSTAHDLALREPALDEHVAWPPAEQLVR